MPLITHRKPPETTHTIRVCPAWVHAETDRAGRLVRAGALMLEAVGMLVDGKVCEVEGVYPIDEWGFRVEVSLPAGDTDGRIAKIRAAMLVAGDAAKVQGVPEMAVNGATVRTEAGPTVV